MANTELLEIVDENDCVIGTHSRADIHTLGLRHREVHVWFVTLQNEIIFQRRSATKDTFPNLLSASVGGHVEIGQTYEQAAIREIEEEAGVTITAEHLHPLAKLQIESTDDNGKKNNPFRQVYWVRYQGRGEELLVEKQDGAGFVLVPASRVFKMTPANCGEVVSALFQKDYMPAWEALQKALEVNGLAVSPE